jgi:hypothetical protein
MEPEKIGNRKWKLENRKLKMEGGKCCGNSDGCTAPQRHWQ